MSPLVLCLPCNQVGHALYQVFGTRYVSGAHGSIEPEMHRYLNLKPTSPSTIEYRTIP